MGNKSLPCPRNRLVPELEGGVHQSAPRLGCELGEADAVGQLVRAEVEDAPLRWLEVVEERAQPLHGAGPHVGVELPRVPLQRVRLERTDQRRAGLVETRIPWIEPGGRVAEQLRNPAGARMWKERVDHLPGVPVLGCYADVARAALEHGVSRIVVASCERRGTLPVADLLDLKLGGVAIEEGIDFYERVTGKIFVPALKPSQLVFARGYEVRQGPLLLKRAFDVAAAAAGLLLGLPILALAAVAIKLD